MGRLFVAAALAVTMGFLASAQELGGIPTAWTGDYVYLVYELTRDPPPTFATRHRMTFTIEFSTRPDGTRRARIELDGEFPPGPPGVGLDGVLSIMLHSPMMGLHGAYLDMVEPPLVPGGTYELQPPPYYADMPPEFAVPMPKGRLEIGEEELEVAGVIAVEAILTLVHELHGEKFETSIWLALPKDPVLPYPVWVRPPGDDPSAAWMPEVKLVAFRLHPPPPTITVRPGESIQEAIDAAAEVDGDGGFLDVPGVTGSGTIGDPFVITGAFDAEGGPVALRVMNTRAHFVIEGATFRGASEAGLWLEDVENGWVVGCVFEENHVGVRVGGDVADVTFTLNTFRANGQHAVGTARAVRWDDGRVGNWWEGYLGTDADGDAIGDVPHEVVPAEDATDAQVDRFPLVSPLAGVEPPEGSVLLQVRADVGDRRVSEAELSMVFVMTILGERVPMEMNARMVLEQVVMERRGRGSSYDVRLTILEDEGTVTSPVLGDEEYESDAGQISWLRVFRFGGYEELDGGVLPTAPVPIFQLGWPARWMRVGDTWTRTVESSADELGIPGGSARFTAVFKLERVEERDGQLRAVVAVEGEIDIKGVEEDPFLGRTEFIMEGTFSGISVLDMASGHDVESSLTISFAGDIVASGSPIGAMDVRMSMAGRDLVREAPPEPVVPDEIDRVRLLEARLEELAARVVALEEVVQAQEERLEGLVAPPPVRIAVVDAETLFTRVFLPQVQAERAAMEAKAREIQSLQADYAAGRIGLDSYQQRYLRLQAEQIRASLNVNLAMLDKMIASPGFLNMRADLVSLRSEARPLESEAEALIKEAQTTIRDPSGFSDRLHQLQTAFQQLDQLLTQVAAAKILEIAQQVAREDGYDLVLRTKDVVMFWRELTIIDLSSDVEGRLWGLFPAR